MNSGNLVNSVNRYPYRQPIQTQKPQYQQPYRPNQINTG